MSCVYYMLTNAWSLLQDNINGKKWVMTFQVKDGNNNSLKKSPNLQNLTDFSVTPLPVNGQKPLHWPKMFR